MARAAARLMGERTFTRAPAQRASALALMQMRMRTHTAKRS